VYKKSQVLDAALAALREATGLTARVVRRGRESLEGAALDAWVQVRLDGETYEFGAEVKAVDRFEVLTAVKERLAPSAESPLLVAPSISPAVADRCRELGLSFVDTAGNVHLTAPGLFVFVSGRRAPSALSNEGFRAQTGAGLKVCFALLCRRELASSPYREIARIAGTSSGAITRVLRDLRSRGLLSEGKPRRLLDPKALLDEWVIHYPIRLRPKALHKRFAGERETLLGVDLWEVGGLWSGDVAGARLTDHMSPATFTLYTKQPTRKLVAALRLRSDPAGNVEILDRFWSFESGLEPDLVPPVLAYADLLASGDSRAAEAARIVYERHIEPGFAAVQTAA